MLFYEAHISYGKTYALGICMLNVYWQSLVMKQSG